MKKIANKRLICHQNTPNRSRLVSIQSGLSTNNSSILPSVSYFKSINSHKFESWPKKTTNQISYISCNKIIRQKADYANRIKAIRYKLQKAEEIRQKYFLDEDFAFDITKVNLEKVERKARIRFEKRIKRKAVNIIQTWWKKFIIKRKLLNSEKIAEKCAIKIQRKWKSHLKYLERKRYFEVLQKSAEKIQKNFKGYMVRKKNNLDLKRLRMEKVFEYFDRKRYEILEQSARVIIKYWKAYKSKKETQLVQRAQTVSPSLGDEPTNFQIYRETKKQNPKAANFKKASTITDSTNFMNKLKVYASPNSGLETIKEVKGK
jgi:IQ calmodulin-binding motif